MKWRSAIFWTVLGTGALVSALFGSWAELRLGGYSLNVGWLGLFFAFLLTLRNLLLKREFQLDERELHDFGDKLVECTPAILKMIESGTPVKQIAEKFNKSHGIPVLVTMKYIIALGKFSKPAAGQE